MIVDPPIVTPTSVIFTWSGDEAFGLQKRPRLSITYSNADPRVVDSVVLLEMLIGLQLPVWSSMPRVHVVLPEPVPVDSVTFWRRFHSAENVDVSPVDAGRREPVKATDVARKAAVFFGGGKDSLLAWHGLSDVLGEDAVSLIQFVHPFVSTAKARRAVALRQERWTLGPARRAGTRTHVVSTDAISNLTARGRRARPQSYLYALGALPLIAAHGFDLATYGYCSSVYWQRSRAGRITHAFPRSRPEAAGALSEHLSTVLGRRTRFAPSHFAINEYASFTALLRQYPAAFADVVMCTRAGPESRWCGDCPKCLEYAVFGLSNEFVDAFFDYQRLLTSPFVSRLLAALGTDQARTKWGNLPWAAGVGSPEHFTSLCHAIHTAHPHLLSGLVDEEAAAGFAAMRRGWGQRAFPDVGTIPRAGVHRTGDEAVKRFSLVVERAIPVVEDWTGPHLRGNESVLHDFSSPMPWPPPGVDEPPG